MWLSLPSASGLVQGVLAGCYQPLLPMGSSRRYLCESFLGCLVPYPGGSHRVHIPVSSSVTLPSESVSHNWLYFVVVVVVDKWEAAFCFPLIHSLFSSGARRQLAIAAVLRFQSCSNCVGLT